MANKNNKNVIVIGIIFLVVGLLIGFLISNMALTGEAKSLLKSSEINTAENYKFTAKELEMKNNVSKNYDELIKKMNTSVSKENSLLSESEQRIEKRNAEISARNAKSKYVILNINDLERTRSGCVELSQGTIDYYEDSFPDTESLYITSWDYDQNIAVPAEYCVEFTEDIESDLTIIVNTAIGDDYYLSGNGHTYYRTGYLFGSVAIFLENDSKLENIDITVFDISVFAQNNSQIDNLTSNLAHTRLYLYDNSFAENLNLQNVFMCLYDESGVDNSLVRFAILNDDAFLLNSTVLHSVLRDDSLVSDCESNITSFDGDQSFYFENGGLFTLYDNSLIENSTAHLTYGVDAAGFYLYDNSSAENCEAIGSADAFAVSGFSLEDDSTVNNCIANQVFIGFSTQYGGEITNCSAIGGMAGFWLYGDSSVASNCYASGNDSTGFIVGKYSNIYNSVSNANDIYGFDVRGSALDISANNNELGLFVGTTGSVTLSGQEECYNEFEDIFVDFEFGPNGQNQQGNISGWAYADNVSGGAQWGDFNSVACPNLNVPLSKKIKNINTSK